MKDIISYDEFAKLDLRVGKVITASLPEWSEKLIRYEVDFGPSFAEASEGKGGNRRVMFSGIRGYVKPEEMVGKKYVFVVNMAYKKMGPEESQGMMTMADPSAGSGQVAPVLIEVSDIVEAGTVVR